MKLVEDERRSSEGIFELGFASESGVASLGMYTDEKENWRDMEVRMGNLLIKKAVENILFHRGDEGRFFRIHRNGVPGLEPDLGVNISLSHTKGFICAAASSGRIGIDCETIRTISSGLMKKYTSREEVKILGDGGNVNELLTMIWCAKEAAFKLYGKRSKMDFHSVNLVPLEERFLPCNEEKKITQTKWRACMGHRGEALQLRLIRKKRYIIALARDEKT